MRTRLRLGRFQFQVRLVLVLLVLFLAALDLLNLHLLHRSKRSLAQAEGQRALAQLELIVQRLGTGLLVQTIAEGETTGVTSTTLRRHAARFGCDHLALLDRAGREVLASGPAAGLHVLAFEELPERRRAVLGAGRPVIGALRPATGGPEARLTAFLPLVDEAGRWVGSVAGTRRVEELGRLVGVFRRVLAIQVVGVLLIAVVAVVFANWISRPYRRLAAAADEAGLTSPTEPLASEPEELAAAFKTVVGKLRQQDEALHSLGQDGGGLGDLVRFARKGAHSMATGVLVVDRRGRVAAANPAAGSLLGAGGADLRGRRLEEATARVSELAPRARACLEQGVGLSREVFERREPRESPGHLGVSISPAAGWGDEVAGALILMTDLTEIRALQEQARLRESLAAVGQLSAGIAHEFRNALGTILGYARMLEKRDDPQVRRPAREIRREVEQVRSVVNEFLLYAKPPEPTRQAVAIEQVLRGCAAAAPDGLVVELEGEFASVLADEGLLRRAFDNLLRNASDSGPARARRVRVTGRPAGSGRTLQIDVEDDGPGIPAEIRDQIFVPFFTTRDRGTGLGLALVQRTLVDLGGSIEVGSASRWGGALFRIRLPLSAETAVPPVRQAL